MTYTDFGEFKKQVKNIMPGFIFFVGIVLSFSCVVTIIIEVRDIKKRFTIKLDKDGSNCY